MTAYEIFSLMITLISLLVGVVAVILKLFAYLDSRYKRKYKPHPKTGTLGWGKISSLRSNRLCRPCFLEIIVASRYLSVNEQLR